MKKIYCVLISLLFALGVVAQQPSRRQGMDRVGQQIKHYVETFNLNETQTQQFDTLYKAYCKQLLSIRVKYQNDNDNERATLTDEQIEQLILGNFAQSRDILNVREQYYKEFRKVLTPSQINTIFEDEKNRRAQIRKKQ